MENLNLIEESLSLIKQDLNKKNALDFDFTGDFLKTNQNKELRKIN